MLDQLRQRLRKTMAVRLSFSGSIVIGSLSKGIGVIKIPEVLGQCFRDEAHCDDRNYAPAHDISKHEADTDKLDSSCTGGEDMKVVHIFVPSHRRLAQHGI